MSNNNKKKKTPAPFGHQSAATMCGPSSSNHKSYVAPTKTKTSKSSSSNSNSKRSSLPKEDDILDEFGTMSYDKRLKYKSKLSKMKQCDQNKVRDKLSSLHKLPALEQEMELKRIFDGYFDDDHDGALDKEELKIGMERLGHALNSAELDAMVKECDDDGDGQIDFNEFKNIIQ